MKGGTIQSIAGYFDNLLDSYRPPASRAEADEPWGDSPEAPATIEEMPLVAPAADAPETAAPGNSPLVAPDAGPYPGSPPFNSDASDDAPMLHLIAHDDWDDGSAHSAPPLALSVKASDFDDRSASALDDDAPTVPGTPDVSIETTNIFSETHIHEIFQAIDSGAEAQDPPAPADFELEAPGFEEEDTDAPPYDAEPRADIEALERELGTMWNRINGDDAALGEIFFYPDDFEPESGALRADDPTEVLREVTNEIVREVHHHHHHEAQVKAPTRSAPRSAAEASQIGPIQFASDWKTRGGD